MNSNERYIGFQFQADVVNVDKNNNNQPRHIKIEPMNQLVIKRENECNASQNKRGKTFNCTHYD